VGVQFPSTNGSEPCGITPKYQDARRALYLGSFPGDAASRGAKLANFSDQRKSHQ